MKCKKCGNEMVKWVGNYIDFADDEEGIEMQYEEQGELEANICIACKYVILEA